MKKIVSLIVAACTSALLVNYVTAQDVAVDGGVLDRTFSYDRTLYYVHTDGAVADISIDDFEVIKKASLTLPNDNPTKAVTVLRDRNTGKEYRFVMMSDDNGVKLTNFDFDSENSKLFVSGNTASEDALLQIVYLPDYSEEENKTAEELFDELSDEEIKNNIIEFSQLKSSFDYTYIMPDNAELGNYMLIINEMGAGQNKTVYQMFYYISPKTVAERLKNFSNIKSVLEYEEFIKNNSKILNLDMTEYNKLKNKSIMFDLVKGKLYSEGEGAKEFKKDFLKGTALTLYNESLRPDKGEVLWEKKDILELNVCKIELLIENQSAVSDMMADSYDSYEKLYDDFEKNVSTEYINEAKGSELKTRFAEVKDKIGLSETDIEKIEKLSDLSNIYTSIRNKNFKSSSELVNSISLAINEKKTSDSKTGNNHKSSGGSSSAFSGMGVILTEQKEKQETVYEPEYEKPVINVRGFTDLDTVPWAEEAIYYLYDMGSINGKTSNLYAPLDDITREEFIKILISTFDITLTDEKTVFSDVDDRKWYAKYVNTAYENEIVQGKGDNLFGVGEKITRQDMCVMLDNMAKKMGIDISVKDTYDNVFSFDDKNNISEYAIDSIQKLYKKGIVTGMGDNIFAPKLNANRAMAAVIIYRLYIAGL